MCHFYPGMELKLGVFGFFLNQNNRGSSGAYATRIYCGLGVMINMPKTPQDAQTWWTRLFLRAYGRQTPKTLPF